MAISEEEVSRLHKANRPSAQVHLRTETTKLIIYSYVECELQFVCGRMYKNYSTVYALEIEPLKYVNNFPPRSSSTLLFFSAAPYASHLEALKISARYDQW